MGLEKENTIFLLVDVQKNLVPAMKKDVYDEKLRNISLLVKSANVMNIPICYTEHYVKGLGETVEELKSELKDATRFEKITFSATGDERFFDYMNSLREIKNVVIFGMESHVCVFQTSLGLLGMGFNVYYVSDAVMSRKKSDWKTAIEYLAKRGVNIVSTEMITFLLLKRGDSEEFRKILKIIK